MNILRVNPYLEPRESSGPAGAGAESTGIPAGCAHLRCARRPADRGLLKIKLAQKRKNIDKMTEISQTLCNILPSENIQ